MNRSNNTPVKRFAHRPNDFCRVCKENIKFSGRSQVNIFANKNQKFLDHFQTVTASIVEDVNDLSQVLCQKCYRIVVKYHRILEQFQEVLVFRRQYKESLSINSHGLHREKRCAKDSQTADQKNDVKSSRKKACRFPTAPKSKRKLCIPECSDFEDPFTNLDVNALYVDSRDQGSRVRARTEVLIHYPSGLVKKEIGELDTVVRHLANNDLDGVATSLWKNAALKEKILQKVYCDIDRESTALCSDKNPSLLKKTAAQDLIHFSEQKCAEELKARAPVLYGCMLSICLKRKKVSSGDELLTSVAAPISMAASTLLRHRCPQMSALAYRFSLAVLWHSGAKKQGFVRASRWGISLSHTSTLRKLDEMGKGFDSEVKNWKSNLEKYHFIGEMLDCVEEYVTVQEVQKQELIPVGFSTTNIGNLDFEFPKLETSIGQCSQGSESNDSDLENMDDFLDDYKQYREVATMDADNYCPVSHHILKSGYSEDDHKALLDFVSETSVGGISAIDKVDLSVLKAQHNMNEPAKFQIIGDNLDMYVKVKHMSSDKQNRSIHWFAMNAIQDRVSLKPVSNNKQLKPILEVENSEFLPSREDNSKLLNDFIPLFARVLVNRIPDFKCFEGAVIKHIPHLYSSEMKKKSVQVPLGILFKNENLNDDMIEILEHIQSEYVPAQKKTTESGEEVTETIGSLFFGGDQLTEERGRNAKAARGDGDTHFERLEGVDVKHEDWHAVRLLYQIMYDILYKPSSASDHGTMCCNMNVTNNINAKTNKVEDNFNYCKDFVSTETEAYIVAAMMEHLDMKCLDDEVVPQSIKTASIQEKQQWLYGHVQTVVENHVMKRQTEECNKMVVNVDNLNKPKQRTVYSCTECEKTYFYKKSRDNHLNRVHNIVPNEPEVELNPPKQVKDIKEDYVYNYACVRLSLGMLILNFNDAVREGDGARIVRCWKYMLLLFKGHGHTKYALAALQLIAYTQAILSPEKAHSLIWNRTVNNKGGIGKNISMDLRMEHIIHLHKEMLGNLGANLHQVPSLRCSRAVKAVEDMLSSVDDELHVRRPSGKHTVTRSHSDFEAIVSELHNRAEVFVEKTETGREHDAFPKFKRSVLTSLEYDKLNAWFNLHKKHWAKQGF